jgi:cAMP-dependent protein kinase regulator
MASKIKLLTDEQNMSNYLDESGVNEILCDLVADICVSKPEKPVEYMISFLTDKYLNKNNNENDYLSAIPKRMLRKRRNAVSAEPVTSLEMDNIAISKESDKNDEQKARIEEALLQNILFNHLDEHERAELCKVMVAEKYKAGETIIEQGDPIGDHFYIVDEGECEIFKTTDGSTEKVQHVEVGGSFGELALIYNTPRQATVKAGTDVILFSINRITYRKVLMDATMKKRALFEGFLEQVPILSSLQKYERLTIADALEPIEFEAGSVIVRQGEPGDTFYIIVEGEAKVEQIQGTDVEPKQVASLKPSDYFGEIALLTNRPRAATVIAETDIKCIKLDRDRFNRVLGPCEEILRRNMEAYNRYMGNHV